MEVSSCGLATRLISEAGSTQLFVSIYICVCVFIFVQFLYLCNFYICVIFIFVLPSQGAGMRAKTSSPTTTVLISWPLLSVPAMTALVRLKNILKC